MTSENKTTVQKTWTPEAVDITINNAAKSIATAVIAVTVVKGATKLLTGTTHDVVFTLLQRKLYKF